MSEKENKKGFGDFGTEEFKPVIKNPTPLKMADEFEPRDKRVQTLLTKTEYDKLVNLAGNGTVSSFVRDVLIAILK